MSQESTAVLPGAPLCPPEDVPVTSTTTYLNSAALGLIPRPVREAHNAFATQLSERGTLAFFESVDTLMQAPYDQAALLFNTPVENIALATSVSEVVSQVAWWLRPGRGQNVVSTNVNSPAATYPWLRVGQDTGVEVRFADGITDPAALSFEKIAALVDDNTAAISVSHVEWATGHRFDLVALSELARRHDAVLVVDAIQSAGVVPIDAPATGADIIVTGSFKWLSSYSGNAIAYVRPEFAERFRPILAGARSAAPKPPYGGDDMDASVLTLSDGARQLEYGSSTHVGKVALGVAIEYLRAIGIERIEQHVHALTGRLADGIERLGGRVVTPRGSAGILSARFDGHVPLELSNALEARDVIVAPRLGLIRFSPHFFNSFDDIDRALNVLEQIL